ncbi:MAG TPA: ABC transporter permease, partial [Terriglobales bacterium]
MAISWRNRIRRRRWHDERSRELEAYIEIEADALRAQGYTSADARRAAERKLGNRTLLLEDIYLMNSAGWFDRTWQDLRLSLRLLRKAPGFSLVVIFTLALGIGASTAIFSVMDTVLLKPLAYPDAERIVMPLRQVPPHIQLGYDAIPWGVNDYKDLASSPAFAAVGAFKPDAFNLTGAGAPSRLDGLRASAGLWPALGLTAALGRTFNAAEDQPGHDHVVVLGDAVWRKNFNADPAIVGRTIDLNATPYTVVGVMPPGFDFPRAAEMPPVFNFARSTEIWVP